MSTAVSCLNTGRAYLMIEIELDFFQVGESRIQDIREMELETKPG
jgi:DNA modification methylase